MGDKGALNHRRHQLRELAPYCRLALLAVVAAEGLLFLEPRAQEGGGAGSQREAG